MKRVKVYENTFARHYGLKINEKQRKGSAWDCSIPTTGEKIELKADLMGGRTGNHFVEFRYSNCEGESWDESGLTLAAKQADYWVVYFGEPDEYHWFKPKEVLQLIEDNDFPIKAIRRNLYGNSGKVRCEGWIIPKEVLKLIEIEPPVSPMDENVIQVW